MLVPVLFDEHKFFSVLVSVLFDEHKCTTAPGWWTAEGAVQLTDC